MNKVSLGVLLSIGALILLHQNQWVLGLAAFILGILIMNKR